MSLRTPLSRVLGHGSAKEGTAHFVSQRISAIALVLLGGWFLVSMYLLESTAYLEVVRYIGRPLNSVLLSLLSVIVAYHSYLGVQVVIEDYVHAPGLKLLALIGSRFAHTLIAVASVYAVIRIGLII
ncbi:MAG: succinate dehydrogenase, hydrophobic membrane anchor protein [Gammaproteobacteria bacterium]|nr:succinate dehydrogenase, hydrophobic membrane anchor protein [Gammaproteobacteria bacterium]